MRPKPILTDHALRYTIPQLVRVWTAEGHGSPYDRGARGRPSKRSLRRQLGRLRTQKRKSDTNS